MRRKAILIGAPRKSLDYAYSDFLKIEKVLKENNYQVFSDFNSSEKVLIPKLRKIIVETRRQDTLLFYFIGHSKNINKTLHLALNETDLNDSFAYVRAPILLDLMHECKAKNKLVILDSCEAGAIEQDVLKKHNFGIIAGSQAWEDVIELQHLKSSFLSYYFERALSYAEPYARNAYGHVTVHSFLDFIENKYKEVTPMAITRPILIGKIRAGFQLSQFYTEAIQNTLHHFQYLIERVKKIESNLFLLQQYEKQDDLFKEFTELEKQVQDLGAQLNNLADLRDFEQRVLEVQSDMNVLIEKLQPLEEVVIHKLTKRELLEEVEPEINLTKKLANVFINHGRKSNSYQQLVIKLNILLDINIGKLWDQRTLVAGEHREEKMVKELRGADIVLLWIEDAYMEDQRCIDLEREALKAGKIVLPILYSECLYEVLPFYEHKLDLLVEGEISDGADRINSKLTTLARRIREVCQSI